MIVRVFIMNGEETHYINISESAEGSQGRYTALCGKSININEISAYTVHDNISMICPECSIEAGRQMDKKAEEGKWDGRET